MSLHGHNDRCPGTISHRARRKTVQSTRYSTWTRHMTMWVWFGLAAVALIGEISSGTFYLLLVALALAAGGIAALLAVGFEWQLVACAVLALLGLLVMRRSGVFQQREINAGSNTDRKKDNGH